MLEGLLHPKKETKEYLCALIVSSDAIDAALWESKSDGKTEIIATAHASYESEWDKAIDAADTAISTVEEKLPDGYELKKVVFGLYPEWLSEDHIKEVYLKKLKQLTAALSLTPVGFVELPIAVSHLLTKEEGAQQTVILVGFEKKYITLSLFKIGKLIGSRNFERSENASADVEKALISYTDVEVLPSRILLYGSVENLEAVKTELLSYPWQKKANFLHFPKIELLPAGFAVRAVAIASATELMPHEEVSSPVENVAGPEPMIAPGTELKHASTSAEVASIAQDLGFADDGVIPATEPDTMAPSVTAESESDMDNVSPVEVPSSTLRDRLPKFSLPNFQFSLTIPSFSKMGIIIILAVLLLLLGAGAFAAVYMLPKATVTVLVSPQIFDKTESVIIDTKLAQIDSSLKSIPAKTTTVDMSDSGSMPASGTKTVGDKASGEVTIFNKTLNTKQFKAGTRLTSGKLGFTLTSDVTVASASESVGSLTYGTTKAPISATAIGSTSNLSTNADFIFDGLPSTSYTARNEQPLAGGTSREVQVVTKDDQKQLKSQVLAQLNEKVKQQLNATLTGGETVLDGSQQQEVTKELYSKDVGEEAGAVSLDLTVTMEVATYKKDDLLQLISQVIDSSKPEGYSYRPEDVSVNFDSVEKEKNGTWTVKPHVQVKLVPELDISSFSQEIKGKTISEAAQILKQNHLVAGVEFAVQAPFEFLKQKLPTNATHINFQVSSL